MTIEQLVKELQLYTTSGNDVPIELCTIKAKDLAIVLTAYQQLLDSLLNIITAVMSSVDIDDSDWVNGMLAEADILLDKHMIENIEKESI